MDKDHLIELISNSLLYKIEGENSTDIICDFKKSLEKLNLDQLTMTSGEYH